MEKRAILMSGIAGSGKSTWANNYVKDKVNTLIISTDSIRYELFKSYVLPPDQERIVQKTIMERVAKAANQGLDIIIDIAVVKNKNRIKWFNKLRAYYKIIDLVIINTDLETCLKQNQMRDRHVPEWVIRSMDQMKEEPNEEIYKLFNSVKVI